MTEIHLILIFMIAAAIIAIEVKDLLSSVIAVGAVGIGLSMAFIVLKAPDLAIMQLVVEILSLVILIRATIHKDLPFSTSGRWIFNTVSTIFFVILFLSLAYLPLSQIQRFGEPIMRVSRTYLIEGFFTTGTHNIVTAIMVNFRALDTLGEMSAFFAAVIGVLAVSRAVARK